MRSKLIYWLVYSGMWLFSALPFRVLYMFSDLNYLLMYHIGKYRRKVVRGNLLRSFPEKTDAERLQIERKFYRYLSDYMLEDLKLLHMSAEELCVRMTYKNPVRVDTSSMIFPFIVKIVFTVYKYPYPQLQKCKPETSASADNVVVSPD